MPLFTITKITFLPISIIKKTSCCVHQKAVQKSPMSTQNKKDFLSITSIARKKRKAPPFFFIPLYWPEG